MGTLLNTEQAAQHLTKQGKPMKEATLSSLRVTGGGPIFCKEDGGKHVFYDTDDLDAWSPEKKHKPMTKYSSTGEYRKAKA